MIDINDIKGYGFFIVRDTAKNTTILYIGKTELFELRGEHELEYCARKYMEGEEYFDAECISDSKYHCHLNLEQRIRFVRDSALDGYWYGSVEK